MAVTVPSDIFSPAIVTQIASEEAYESIPLLQSGYINDARGSATRVNGGTTISFPYLKDVSGNSGVQTNPRNGTQVTSDALEIDFEDVTMLSKIISFANDEKALQRISNFKDPNAWMAQIYKRKMSEHIQAAMITTADTTTDELAIAGNITLAGIKKAMITVWGDKANNFTPLVALHSKVAYDLEISTELTNARQYGGNAFAPSPIMNVAGMNFIMMDGLPINTATTPDTFSGYIIAPGAIDLWMDPSDAGYGEQRRERTTTWVSDFWFDFATHLAVSSEPGVIRLETQSSLVTS